MMPANPNEAPPGCIAVENARIDACFSCCMLGHETGMCSIYGSPFKCGKGRADRTLVHFEFHDGAATASWPYDSEGTPA